MKNTEKIIAIAEACGWRQHPDNDSSEQKFWTLGGESYGLPNGGPYRRAAMPPVIGGVKWGTPALPDYTNDLNAMHEAEKILNGDEQHTFEMHLLQMPDLGWEIKGTHATAAQRSEAFLKTINLWKE